MKSKKTLNSPDQPHNSSLRAEYLPELRHAYSPRLRSNPPVVPGLGGAKQSFKNECDINQIMAKYQKTGAIAHCNKHEAQYGFASGADYQESINLVMEAQKMFDDLPSSLRKKFGNDPENYLDFVQDPANISEMIELGLLETKKTTERVNTTHRPEGEESPPKAAEKSHTDDGATEEHQSKG